MLNWTCPGGYLNVQSALWKSVNSRVCTAPKSGIMTIDVTTHMEDKCDNKTFCDFTVNDSSFGVSCNGKCAGLDYGYECVSKSLA